MNLFIAIFIGLLAAIAVPASVRNNPDTFNGMLKGQYVHIPFTYESMHLSFPVWIGVTALIWFLMRLARS